MSRKLPVQFEQTYRQFKKQKRIEFNATMDALDNLRLGCAYLPPEAYMKLSKAERLFKEAHKICKPWWRKA